MNILSVDSFMWRSQLSDLSEPSEDMIARLVRYWTEATGERAAMRRSEVDPTRIGGRVLPTS